MSRNLISLQGLYKGFGQGGNIGYYVGSIIGVLQGETRSLDYIAHIILHNITGVRLTLLDNFCCRCYVLVHMLRIGIW